MREKVAFGLGDIGTNFYLQTIAVFLVFFYTDVLGISAALAGIIALICRLFDAFNDIYIGYKVDKTGNTKKWIIWGAALSVITFFIMFLTPDFSEGGKFVYALITFAIFTITYTCYGIPINAMASTITGDQKERMSLNAVRFPFIAIPILIASAATVPLVSMIAPTAGKLAYPIVFGIYGLIGLVLAIVCVKVVKERNPIIKKTAGVEKLNFKDVVKSFVGNKPAIIAVLIFFLFFLQYYINQASLMYYFAYVLNDVGTLTLFSLASLPFMVIGFMLSGKLCRSIGKKKLVFWIGIIILVTYAIRYLFVASLLVQIIFNVIFSIIAGLMCVICYNMVGDAVTYAHYKTGKQVIAVFYSTAIFSQKVGMALSAFIVGGTLSAFGYVANAVQTPSAIFGIMSIYTIIPAILAVVMGFVGLGWSIDNHECFKTAEEPVLTGGASAAL
jgi:GPH family glycoside/pentoside/hexuronide:cation symporter